MRLSITDLRAPWLAEQTLPIVFNHGIGTNRHVWSGYGEAPSPAADAPWWLDDLAADLT